MATGITRNDRLALIADLKASALSTSGKIRVRVADDSGNPLSTVTVPYSGRRKADTPDALRTLLMGQTGSLLTIKVKEPIGATGENNESEDSQECVGAKDTMTTKVVAMVYGLDVPTSVKPTGRNPRKAKVKVNRPVYDPTANGAAPKD